MYGNMHRVWDKLNYYFEMHLNYLGPVSHFFSILNSPQDASLGTAVVDGLMAGNILLSADID